MQIKWIEMWGALLNEMGWLHMISGTELMATTLKKTHAVFPPLQQQQHPPHTPLWVVCSSGAVHIWDSIVKSAKAVQHSILLHVICLRVTWATFMSQMLRNKKNPVQELFTFCLKKLQLHVIFYLYSNHFLSISYFIPHTKQNFSKKVMIHCNYLIQLSWHSAETDFETSFVSASALLYFIAVVALSQWMLTHTTNTDLHNEYWPTQWNLTFIE